MEKRIQHLVVDSGVFIKGSPIHELAENVYTVSGAIKEIRDKATKQRLQFLPYKLIIKEPSAEACKHVLEFTKKSGDYASLSAVDQQILALTYQLHKENVGTDTLNQDISCKVLQHARKVLDEPLIGFYEPKKKSKTKNGSDPKNEESGYDDQGDSEEVGDQNEKGELEEESYPDTDICLTLQSEEKGETEENDKTDKKDESDEESDPDEDSWCTAQSDVKGGKDYLDGKDDLDKKDDFDGKDESDEKGESDESGESDKKGDCWICEESVEKEESVGEGESNEDCESDESYESDEDSWLTPQNIAEIKEKMRGVTLDSPSTVACVSTDFAIQNSLILMGLHVVSVDGMRIKRASVFILRCHSCFKTTNNISKIFCPNCGNKTLKRVAVTVNEDGTKKVHINFRRPINIRGTNYSLPYPKGGKHSTDPIVCEDQPIPQNKPSKKALQKMNILSDDYILGTSPFRLNDVFSRAAHLGIRPNILRHNRTIPNEGIRTGNKKKRNK